MSHSPVWNQVRLLSPEADFESRKNGDRNITAEILHCQVVCSNPDNLEDRLNPHGWQFGGGARRVCLERYAAAERQSGRDSLCLFLRIQQ